MKITLTEIQAEAIRLALENDLIARMGDKELDEMTPHQEQALKIIKETLRD